MIETSSAYKALMEDNIRPKCEPIIVVSGVDNQGNDTTIRWEAKDITELTYRRGIDPVGRELPYMELTWTEIYKGKLNAQSYPEKYGNIVKYMQVELSFVQNLSFFNTWQILKNTNATWKSIKNKTWKTIKNKTTSEKITLPLLYLDARPTVDGQTIRWTARDLLSFLEENQVKSFKENIPFLNPIIYLVLNERGSFLNSPKIFKALTDTATELQISDTYEQLNKQIIFNSTTKDELKNYGCLRNLHWNFKDGIITPKTVEEYLENNTNYYSFSKRVILEYPKVTNGTNISSYIFKNYVARVDMENGEVMSPTETLIYDGASINRYNFKGYGYAEVGGTTSEIDYAIAAENSLTVYPVNYDSYDNAINNSNVVGEAYIEDNPINPYSDRDEEAENRFEFLNNYFNAETSALEFESLANPAIEPGDICEIITNLYDGDTQISKNAIVVEIEIKYNGSMKESFIAHEVNVDDN